LAWSLTTASRRADTVPPISSSEIGQRVSPHHNVIAAEHKATEDELRASRVPFVILRNGWYTP
jgi:NAD(P)H dehydrogenase (quinone)